MINRIATRFCLAISLSIGIVPGAEAQETLGLAVKLSRVPITDLSRYLCPNGYMLSPWTAEYCNQPDGGSCTTYWCVQKRSFPPVPGQSTPLPKMPPKILATTNPKGSPTTICTQNRDPCTHDIPDPRTSMPTLRQLVETVPDLFPRGFENVRMVRPDKP
jgi:hypothetical protein